MMKLLFSVVVALGLLGCSTLETWLSSAASKRSFQVRPLWVKQGPSFENLGFRKLNRFKPLFYKSEKLGDLIIQANSLDGVTAHAQTSGNELWRLSIVNGVESSAVINGQSLYFGASDGQFYSVSVETGQVQWTFPTRIENISEPLVQDGVVYFLTGANSLYALDATSGKQIWLYSRADSQTISIRGGSKPVIRGDTVYAGFSDGAVAGLLIKNGQLKWEKQLSKNKRFRDLDSNPVIDQDVLYIFGYDDATYALRAATGDLVWRFDKGGYGGFLMNNDKLYFASSTGELICLDRSTGRSVWTYKVQNGIATTPSLMKGLIVFGESMGALRFVDSVSGKEVGHFYSGRGVFSPISIDDKKNQVLFMSNEANLWALEAKWDRPEAFSYLK